MKSKKLIICLGGELEVNAAGIFGSLISPPPPPCLLTVSGEVSS